MMSGIECGREACLEPGWSPAEPADPAREHA